MYPAFVTCGVQLAYTLSITAVQKSLTYNIVRWNQAYRYNFKPTTGIILTRQHLQRVSNALKADAKGKLPQKRARDIIRTGGGVTIMQPTKTNITINNNYAPSSSSDDNRSVSSVEDAKHPRKIRLTYVLVGLAENELNVLPNSKVWQHFLFMTIIH